MPGTGRKTGIYSAVFGPLNGDKKKRKEETKMTFDTVRDMIAEQLRVDPASITEKSRLVEDLKADSANVMVMIMDLEDRFGVTVEDDQIMKMQTVGDVVRYIDSVSK